jgi:tetratricopeptide (TPR) repeat protein
MLAMRPSRVLLAAVLAIAAPLSASIDLPRDGDRWTRLDLDDYVIYSAASDRVTRDVAERLQLMRDGLAMITRLTVHPARPVTVLVFPNERAFAPFRDAAMGRKMSHVGGVFLSGGGADYILINADRDGGIDRSVYHELTHSFTYNTAGALPLWFMEGLAEFYSTFEPYRGNQLRVGMPVAEHLEWLRSRGLMPLVRLFAVDRNSSEYSEQYRAGDFYAQSWLLVHYLMIGNPDRNKQLGPFLTLLAAKEPMDSAFEKAFGGKYAQLDNELRRYLSQPTMNVLMYTPAEKHIITIADPKPAARDDVLTTLGTLLVHSSGRADAKAFLDAAIASNPKTGDAYAGLGMLAGINGSDPGKLFDKAVELGTNDANAYIAVGHTELTRLGGMSPATIATQIGKLRAIFEKAIALNPRSPFGYAGLGATYLLNGDDDMKGISAYVKSLALDPHPEIAANLVALYARNGNRDLAAAAIARYIAPSGNAEALDSAREALFMADVARAKDLVRAGKDAEAIPILESARDSATSPELKQQAEEGLRHLRNVEAIKYGVEEVTRAINLANAGKLTEAIGVIDAVLPSIADTELQSDAKKLRGEFAAAAKKKKR